LKLTPTSLGSTLNSRAELKKVGLFPPRVPTCRGMNEAFGSAAEATTPWYEARQREDRGGLGELPKERTDRVRFADASSRARLTRLATIVVRIEAFAASSRGKLAELLDEAIERELAARGATSPGMGSISDRDTSLSDQLFRARQVGVYRMVIALGSLGPLRSQLGALSLEDADTLMFLAAAANERPVELVLDPSDENTSVFLTPVSLKDALANGSSSKPAIEWTEKERVAGTRAKKNEAATAKPRMDEAAGPKPVDPTAKPGPVDAPGVRENAEASKPDGDSTDKRPTNAAKDLKKGTASAAAKDLKQPAFHSVIEKPVLSPTPVDAGEYRHWSLTLGAARGPQPLAHFEKLFRESYAPLCEAIDRGLSDARAGHALEEFRANFAKMYSEVFPSFGVTGKRPKMVFDAPDVAARIGRAHGARAVSLLLVSSLRYDVGKRVKDELAKTERLVDEALLWSALPTTTARQLDCLARGMEALRTAPVSERELEIVRGRTSETIRRMRLGSRELCKLDACEAKIRECGGGAAKLLPAIAETLVRAIQKHAAKLAPKTLLFVFGERGFTFDRAGVAGAGGASPEEVLVPAFALLTSDEVPS
jgi:hypothetical protein